MTRKQLALIHVAKRELGLSEDIYRSLLEGVGVRSSKDLTSRQFDELLTTLKRAGFQHKPKTGTPPANKKPLIGKINALLCDMNLPWSYADGMARHMYKTDLVLWCTPKQLTGIVAALCIHQKRKSGKIAVSD